MRYPAVSYRDQWTVHSDQKFGFTQSYGRSYGGIVPVFIEFTDASTITIDYIEPAFQLKRAHVVNL